jgi:small subunit ribosomal protein S7
MRGLSKYKKKILEPDEKYGSTTVAKFINYVMRKGKKGAAIKIVYSSLEAAAKELKKEPLDVFNAVITAVSPTIEVRSRRIGGANYQIPMEVKEPRKTSLAMRWIIQAAKSRQGAPMAEKLSREFVDAIGGTGAAIKKRTDTLKMAEANRAFAHFAKLK